MDELPLSYSSGLGGGFVSDLSSYLNLDLKVFPDERITTAKPRVSGLNVESWRATRPFLTVSEILAGGSSHTFCSLQESTGHSPTFSQFGSSPAVTSLDSR